MQLCPPFNLISDWVDFGKKICKSVASHSHFNGHFPNSLWHWISLFFGRVNVSRLIILTLVAYWFVGLLCGFFKSKLIILEPGTKSIGTLVVLILISTVASSNTVASTILTVQLYLLWFGSALAYVRLFYYIESKILRDWV